MSKYQLHAFEDVIFRLEVNLQGIRRDLVQLLEGYAFKDCFVCNRIKCCCTSESSSFCSSTLSVTSSNSACPHDHTITYTAYYNVAPPPETLPRPKWPASKTTNVPYQEKPTPISVSAINAWIKASIPNVIQSNARVNFPVPRKVLDEVNYSWPPFPKSIWSGETLKETLERESRLSNRSEDGGNSSVEAFFRHFSRNRSIPKTVIAC